MSVFAMMFFRDPSLLHFQKRIRNCNFDKCLRTRKNGEAIRYSHSVIQATLVEPEQKFITPLLSKFLDSKKKFIKNVKDRIEMHHTKKQITNLSKKIKFLGYKFRTI